MGRGGGGGRAGHPAGGPVVAPAAEQGRAVSYVDAGYVIGLGALFLYAASLLYRRHRLERRVELSEGAAEDGGKAAPER